MQNRFDAANVSRYDYANDAVDVIVGGGIVFRCFPMKRRVYILLLLLALGLLGFLFVQWSFNRPPINLERLDLLKQGMTQGEVCSILGVPTSEWVRTNDLNQVHVEWAYSRPLSWAIVNVYFDPSGRFDRAVYDY
ncbi:MAG: hypothetical protein ACOYCD_02275 [Kiritimatiellia bacterium]